MDGGQRGQRPTLGGLPGDPHDLGFGHARIVFEFQRGQRALLVPADTRKGHDRADIAGLAHPVYFGGDVEIGGLDAHDRQDRAGHESAAGHRRELTKNIIYNQFLIHVTSNTRRINICEPQRMIRPRATKRKADQ